MAGDSECTVDDLKAVVRGFCEERDWDQFHNPKDLAIGMVTEASELLQIFRFRTPEESRALIDDPRRGMDIRDELADVLYFVLRFADMNGIDLSTELRRKVAIDGEKYPVETSRGSNRKYDELRASCDTRYIRTVRCGAGRGGPFLLRAEGFRWHHP